MSNTDSQDQQPLKLLTKDAVLAVDDRPSRIVDVPEWGGAVRVRALSAWEQSQYTEAIMTMTTDHKGRVQTKINPVGADVLLASMGIVDENGKPMFSKNELKDRSQRAIARVCEAIRELSGMNVEVEEAKGN